MIRKLKSSGGASFIVALLVLLICVMVGTVVLTAATANVQNVRERRDEKQEYLTLSSASELVAKGMEDSSFTAKMIYTDKTCNDDPNYNFDCVDATEYEYEGSDGSTQIGAAISPLLIDMAHYVYDNHAPTERTFLIQSANGETREVTVELTMDTGYTVLAQLSLPEGGSYEPFTLKFTPSVTDPGSGTSVTTSETHYVMESILVGSQWVEQEVALEYDIITTTYATTVSWHFAVISKGAVS